MSTEALTLSLAALTILLAIIAVLIAFKTLHYMRGRDLEVDTRNGWIEIHKAMVNLRVQRALVMQQLGQLGGYSSSGPSVVEGLIRDYTLATSQLRGQLDRLNDDVIIVELTNFLEDHLLAAEWQTPEYEKKFDVFCHKVALKSRPT